MYTGHDSVYIGGYSPTLGKAILDGVNGGAGSDGLGGSRLTSSQSSSGNMVKDTWEYLTIRNYASSLNNAVMGNVNGGDSDIGDTYKYNTIGPNDYGWRGDNVAPGTGESSGGGYGIDLADNTTIQYNCLIHNAQGAFNGSGANINISNNEIVGNGLGSYPDTGGDGASPYGCGCSGGGQLFVTVNATLDGNYVHGNYNVGIWLDFDNTGADISGNYIASNWSSGIWYEASYNANITNNTLVGNGWASDGAWPAGYQGKACYGGISCSNGNGPVTGAGGGNPIGDVDLSNSGGDSALTTVNLPGGGSTASRYSGEIRVTGNNLVNSFGGVKVYTDSNRYPDNIDNDSACGIPLGALDQPNSSLYYRQTSFVEGDSVNVSGTSVTVSGGTQTLGSRYGTVQTSDGYQDIHTQAPAVGMGVYDENANKFLGNVASVSSASSFTLDRAPGNLSGTALLISAYGGCGPADYFGGAHNQTSGRPAANYWDHCNWGSRNIIVSGNTFSTDASKITGCTVPNGCGFMTAEVFNAGMPNLVQYFDSMTGLVAHAVNGLGIVWSNNTYHWTGGGPGGWQFMADDQGHQISQPAWLAAPYSQDAGSTFG